MPGKSMVNLHKSPRKQFVRNLSIHKPHEAQCRGKLFMHEDFSPLVVNHYSATLQQMMFRSNDLHGKQYGNNNATLYWIQRYNSKSKFFKHLETPHIQNWLQGFVCSVGKTNAQRLLQHVGDREASAHWISKQ